MTTPLLFKNFDNGSMFKVKQVLKLDVSDFDGTGEVRVLVATFEDQCINT